jgi:hypothetical protein
MTGSTASAAAATKAFFMSSSPRFETDERWRAGCVQLRAEYTHRLWCGARSRAFSRPTCGRRATVLLAASRSRFLHSACATRPCGLVESAMVGRDRDFEANDTATRLAPAIDLRSCRRRLAGGRLRQISLWERNSRIDTTWCQKLVNRIGGIGRTRLRTCREGFRRFDRLARRLSAGTWVNHNSLWAG